MNRTLHFGQPHPKQSKHQWSAKVRDLPLSQGGYLNPSREKTVSIQHRPPRHSPAVVDWATCNVAARPLLLGRHWPLHSGLLGTSRSPPQVVLQASSTTRLARPTLWCIAENKPLATRGAGHFMPTRRSSPISKTVVANPVACLHSWAMMRTAA